MFSPYPFDLLSTYPGFAFKFLPIFSDVQFCHMRNGKRVAVKADMQRFHPEPRQLDLLRSGGPAGREEDRAAPPEYILAKSVLCRGA